MFQDEELNLFHILFITFILIVIYLSFKSTQVREIQNYEDITAFGNFSGKNSNLINESFIISKIECLYS